MKILVSGATKTVSRHQNDKNIGVLVTPQDGNRLPTGILYAADNSAYSNWDEDKFIKLLDRIHNHHYKPIFVASPDVVGDAKRTYELFKKWMPIIKGYNLPVAMVIQNGQEWIGMPGTWDNVDAIFIGGDDEFKLGQWVRYFVGKSKEKGKWVHMGRVNSLKRLMYARDIGCDSVDGTSFSMFPDTYIPKALNALKTRQLRLWK